MTATCRPTLRMVAAAVSRTVAHRPAARTRPQRLVPNVDQQLGGTSSPVPSSLHTAACPHSVEAQTNGTQRAEAVRVPESSSNAERKRALAIERRSKNKLRALLDNTSFPKFLRLITPEAYSGGYREARNLDEALSGVAEWGDTTLAAPVLPRDKFRDEVQRYLTDQQVDVEVVLSYRNAILAKSWPDARRHMISIDDGHWPPLVLLRSISSVSTPSEISDALALLHASIKHSKGNPSSFKALRHCFMTLTRITIRRDGGALYLLPRSTDLLLAMLESFPAEAELLIESINDFVRRCTGVADERAREAVTRILDWLEGQKDSVLFDNARRNVVRHCISSVESSMKSSLGKTASSEQFVDFELMDHLLRQDYCADSDLEQRALRCSIFVSGHACNHERTWQSFNVYQEHKQNHGLAMSGSDYWLLTRALLRSKPGRKEAWHVFLQAERLWRREAEGGFGNESQSRRQARNLEHTCIELLQAMAKSTDVCLRKVLSMLGIFLEGSEYSDGKRMVTGKGFSKVMLARRLDVRAYAVVMHGLLTRKRPKCAFTVWKAMLQRGVMPNAPILSLLLQHLFLMRDVQGAMQQLHIWCEEGVPRETMSRHDRLRDIEVTSLSTTELPDTDMLFSGTPSGKYHQPPAELHLVTPDVVLATVVFSGLHRCGSQGVEALWDAYQLTIQRFPDAPVLAMLLKASSPDEATPTIDATFGRQVFRSLLFCKHPELVEYRNPLNEQLETNSTAGWIFSDHTVGSRMEEWIGSVFQPRKSAFADLAVDRADPSSLVFTSKLFEHYLRLVLHLHHSSGAEQGARASRQELVDLLGWMKELHVTPSATHVALTMLEIEEHLPPAVAARQMDALEAWLTNWLGDKALPEATVMQQHWQWKMARNGQKKGWFDRITKYKQEDKEEAHPHEPE